jgi:hypothetical protein
MDTSFLSENLEAGVYMTNVNTDRMQQLKQILKEYNVGAAWRGFILFSTRTSSGLLNTQ